MKNKHYIAKLTALNLYILLNSTALYANPPTYEELSEKYSDVELLSTPITLPNIVRINTPNEILEQIERRKLPAIKDIKAKGFRYKLKRDDVEYNGIKTTDITTEKDCKIHSSGLYQCLTTNKSIVTRDTIKEQIANQNQSISFETSNSFIPLIILEYTPKTDRDDYTLVSTNENLKIKNRDLTDALTIQMIGRSYKYETTSQNGFLDLRETVQSTATDQKQNELQRKSIEKVKNGIKNSQSGKLYTKHSINNFALTCNELEKSTYKLEAKEITSILNEKKWKIVGCDYIPLRDHSVNDRFRTQRPVSLDTGKVNRTETRIENFHDYIFIEGENISFPVWPMLHHAKIISFEIY